MNFVPTTLLLFAATAVAELVGCYLPYPWLRKDGSIWLLPPTALSLAIFVWLLSLHPEASGRVYAAHGGAHIASALLWLWWVDRVTPTRWDLLGAACCLLGTAIIMFSPRSV
ncbi:YnfA family protein [Xanthomonas hortorum pv. pelargonii]|nr:YnfA family protein [Xanthomonas hortorum pv. pelargonii]